MYRLFLALISSLFSFVFSAYAQEQRPLVVATTGIVADLVKQVAGDAVDIRSLMGPGVDPHLYKATYGDLKLLADAKLIFFNGLHLEGKMQEVFVGLKKRKAVVAIADVLDASVLRHPPEFAGLHDPHIWFNVQLWAQTIKPVEEGLAALIPAKAEAFKVAAGAYRAKLTQLDQWVREQVQLVPERQRVLVTAHDAFGYFGDAYGFEVAGLQGISTASEFGLVDIQRISKLIIERNVKAIFVETSVPQRFVQSIQQGVEAEGKQVAIGGTLYSDALGDAGSGADSYEGMVRANVNTIVGALK